MNCTQCKKDSFILHGETWKSGYGYIINKDELLCDECAIKRPGYRLPGEVLSDKNEDVRKIEAQEKTAIGNRSVTSQNSRIHNSDRNKERDNLLDWHKKLF